MSNVISRKVHNNVRSEMSWHRTCPMLSQLATTVMSQGPTCWKSLLKRAPDITLHDTSWQHTWHRDRNTPERRCSFPFAMAFLKRKFLVPVQIASVDLVTPFLPNISILLLLRFLRLHNWSVCLLNRWKYWPVGCLMFPDLILSSHLCCCSILWSVFPNVVILQPLGSPCSPCSPRVQNIINHCHAVSLSLHQTLCSNIFGD